MKGITIRFHKLNVLLMYLTGLIQKHQTMNLILSFTSFLDIVLFFHIWYCYWYLYSYLMFIFWWVLFLIALTFCYFDICGLFFYGFMIPSQPYLVSNLDFFCPYHLTFKCRCYVTFWCSNAVIFKDKSESSISCMRLLLQSLIGSSFIFTVVLYFRLCIFVCFRASDYSI